MNIFSSSHGGNTRGSRGPLKRDQRHTSASYGGASTGEESAEAGLLRVLSAALFALPVTALVGAVLLLIVTAVAYANPDPDSLTTPLSLAALGLTSVLGGLVAARRGRGKCLLCGLTLGLLWTLLLVGFSLLFGDEARRQLTLGLSSLLSWLVHGGVIFLSALGGKMGGRRAPKSKHRQRR